ncbi:flagellar filament capping protein FliD [Persephonella sp. KM09-Lau-8]|uniref:flagellar filament capping protein FliD n=1 Tax=Persephonella sp. KM09-Lau-8 TaxID=1158345 RepID=UPI0004980DCF|nr:flagellar filament capping protein FliD [Persephonella sp. KM09-Lau-8]
MAGEIYLSNLTGGFDYQQILDSMRALKSQQIYLLQSREDQIKQKKSALSDYAKILNDFKSYFNKVTDLFELDKKKVSVSDENVIDVIITDDTKLIPSTIDIQVNQLAKNDVWLTNGGVDDQNEAISDLDSATLSITYQGNTIDVSYDNTMSLKDIVSQINSTAANSDMNISASIFYDGSQYRLLIQGKDTGSDNTVTISDSGNLSSTLGDFYHAQTAQNAQISIYDQTIESSDNSFENVIAGLTINVKSTSSSPVNINIQQDFEPFMDDLQKMIDKYNELVDFIKNNTGENGILSDEISTLQSVRSGIFNRFDPLFELGILSVDKDTGHISIDSTKLKDMLYTDEETVKSKISQLKDNMYDYLIYITGSDSPIKLKQKSYDKQIQNIEESIELQKKRIDEEIKSLKMQFVALQQLMAQMEDIRQRIAATFGNVSLLNSNQ